MIQEMLENGFGVIAYMHEGELVIGFIQTEGIRTAVEEKDPNTGDVVHTSILSQMRPKVEIDAAALSVGLSFVAKMACDMFFGKPESEND